MADRKLLLAFVWLSLISLSLGWLYGFLVALGRADLVDLPALRSYRLLTLHGVTIFFYWLYFAQAALVLILAAVYTDGAREIGWRALAWTGFAVMTVGFVLSQWAPIAGAALLYDGQPGLVEDHLHGPSTAFYLGYLFLAVGLLLVATSSVRTALTPRIDPHNAVPCQARRSNA